MLAWMIYAALVAIALGAAALIAEQAARSRRMPTRWPWMLAMVASLLLPIAMATVSIRLPDASRTTAHSASLALRDTTSIPVASRVIDWTGTTTYASSTTADMLIRDIWLAGSLMLVTFLGVTTAMFHRRKRGWRPRHVCGMRVLVSANVGPAVVGLMRSQIVIPGWVMQASPDQVRYVLAHERSHLGARDPLVVAMALAFLVAMPWNPMLWWQFHRLRCAIEVDCDARVLREGGDVGAYCETLIQVGENQSEHIAAVTAMSESQSFLERRIRIMLSKPQKWVRASSFALISAALGMAIFAVQVTPPAAAEQVARSSTVTVDPTRLDAYAGEYELSDYSLVTVARKGDGLTVAPIGQFMAQGTIDAPAISATAFTIPSIDARLEFIEGPDHRASSMDVYIHGSLVATANRVDEATAERIRSDLAARVRNQAPFPDSERAIRAVLSRSLIGPELTSAFARAPQIDPASQDDYFAFLGPMQSYKFEGVSDYGWDIYDVQYAHGAQQVFIQLDRKGLIVSTVMRRQ